MKWIHPILISYHIEDKYYESVHQILEQINGQIGKKATLKIKQDTLLHSTENEDHIRSCMLYNVSCLTKREINTKAKDYKEILQ